MKDIQTLWEEDTLPIINGIVYSNGKIEQLDFTGNERNKKSFVEKTTQLSYFPETEISHIISLCQKNITNYIISCGEGSYGGDGFIALTSLENKLIWAIFFDYANPFEKIDITEDKLTVTNNCGDKWFLSILSPNIINIGQ